MNTKKLASIYTKTYNFAAGLIGDTLQLSAAAGLTAVSILVTTNLICWTVDSISETVEKVKRRKAETKALLAKNSDETGN